MDSLEKMRDDCRKRAAAWRSEGEQLEDDVAGLRPIYDEEAAEWDAEADRIESLMSQEAMGEVVNDDFRAVRWIKGVPTRGTKLYAAPQDCEEMRREFEAAADKALGLAIKYDAAADEVTSLRAQLEAEKQGAAAMREALGPLVKVAKGRMPLARELRAAEDALSSDAGRDYAERLRKAEEERQRSDEIAEHHIACVVELVSAQRGLCCALDEAEEELAKAVADKRHWFKVANTRYDELQGKVAELERYKRDGLSVDDDMLARAMKAAVASGMLPKTVDTGTYFRNWNGMKEAINAALNAVPEG